MQIVCPSCSTAYRIAVTAIGAEGRSVRCARCQKVWFVPAVGLAPAMPEAATSEAEMAAAQTELGAEANAPEASTAADGAAQGPPPDTPSAAEEPAAPVALSDIPIPIENSPPLAPDQQGDPPAATVTQSAIPEPADVESVAARRSRAAERRRRNIARMRLPLAIAAMASVLIGLLSWRKEVVRHVPQLASLYSALGVPVNLRGLAFTDLKIGNEIHDGVPVLVVEGAIVSVTSRTVDVPRLRFALRNAAGAEIYAWTTQPPQPKLEAFDAMPFRSRLASPPAEGHDVQVRFFTSRDAVASAR